MGTSKNKSEAKHAKKEKKKSSKRKREEDPPINDLDGGVPLDHADAPALHESIAASAHDSTTIKTKRKKKNKNVADTDKVHKPTQAGDEDVLIPDHAQRESNEEHATAIPSTKEQASEKDLSDATSEEDVEAGNLDTATGDGVPLESSKENPKLDDTEAAPGQYESKPSKNHRFIVFVGAILHSIHGPHIFHFLSYALSTFHVSFPSYYQLIICVGNLPYNATTEAIQAHFSSVNPISIRHRTHKEDPSRSKGFAFLEFDGYERMKTCLKNFHHSRFDDGKGKDRRINVELTLVDHPFPFHHSDTFLSTVPSLPFKRNARNRPSDDQVPSDQQCRRRWEKVRDAPLEAESQEFEIERRAKETCRAGR